MGALFGVVSEFLRTTQSGSDIKWRSRAKRGDLGFMTA